MPRPYAARQVALRLWLQRWENQRRCAEAVREAQRRADQAFSSALSQGVSAAGADAIREATFHGQTERRKIHRSVVEYFLRFRNAAPVLFEAETRAFADFGDAVDRLGAPQARERALGAMLAHARGAGVADELTAELLAQREARELAHSIRVLEATSSFPEQPHGAAEAQRRTEAQQRSAAQEAARAFDEAAGEDELAQAFDDIAWAQSRYAERRPAVRAGDVEVIVLKDAHRPDRRIIARHRDGHHVELVAGHRPHILFPRVHPDAFWLEPQEGRYLVYSSQAAADESGAALTVKDTRSGEVVATIPGADYPDVTWLTPDSFVWCGGHGRRHGLWRFDLATGRDSWLETPANQPDPEPRVFRSVAGTWHPAQRAGHAWTIAAANRGPHNSETELTALDPYCDRDGPKRQTKLLTYADSTLGRPLVTADNRLIVISWSARHPRGRVAEVPVDLDRQRISTEEWHDLVPDDGESVIRDVAVVDRGPGRDPLLAISRTRQGAAEAELFDPATGRGTPIPLAQLGLPGVYAPDGRKLPGVFGQITGMTATVGSDGSALEIEHSSIVSAPRVFRIPLTPHGPGAPVEIPREDTVADLALAGATVTRHNFLAPDGTAVRGLLVDRADAPGAGPLMFTSYSNFFVGNNTSKLWNDVHSTHCAAGGRLWINEGRGTGGDGYRHFLQGVRDNQFGAVMDAVAGIDHILDQGIAEPGSLHASAQSAGPLIMLRAVAQRPGAFAGAVFRRPVHDLWRVLETAPEVAHEYAGTLPNMSSCHYLDPGADMPGHTIVIGAPDDPRIHDNAVMDLFSQLATTTTEPLLRIARPGRGHFPGWKEAAEELTVAARKCGHTPPGQRRPGILPAIRDLRSRLEKQSAGDLAPPTHVARAGTLRPTSHNLIALAGTGVTPVFGPASHHESQPDLAEGAPQPFPSYVLAAAGAQKQSTPQLELRLEL